ncbi:MAG: hypothetical protein IKX88_05330 [Thermoguttaceae bacterium]|nr:hypothetical protein [Thermoguttaceae bacterium]
MSIKTAGKCWRFVLVMAAALVFGQTFVSGQENDSSPRVRTRTNFPPRLKRADSFVGVHFDFHAGKDVPNIGESTTPEMVQEIIDALHPDFIQVDSKGHPGLTSYPTKVGNPAPGVVKDSLRIWRYVTAKNGVALYTHYSGVWDNEAVARHPEWAVVDANGNVSQERTSVFGDYKDKLLVPQLLEMAMKYHTDGVWVDGECWATLLDYCDVAQDAFKNATGYDAVPKEPKQDGWFEWCDFCREAFRQYLIDYVQQVKEKAPNFQIASNWAFTDHMPEPVCADVDFISGDYSPNDSVTAARYSSRLMMTQNVPWDLMAWSFARAPEGNWTPKTGVQISREAACVLAQGGGFQAYITQDPDGAVNLTKLPPVAVALKFCRERQSLCQHSTEVPQIALFCPTKQHYKSVNRFWDSLFPMITEQRAILKRILELNYAVDIQIDETLVKNIESAKTVVFSRGGLWSDELKEKVESYVKNGGSVVSIGNEPLEELKPLLEKAEKISSENTDSIWFLDVYQYGEGKIVVYPTPVDTPQEFVDENGPTFNAYLEKALATAFPAPIVQFSQKQPLDVSVRRAQDGRLCVHLVNVSGPHEQEAVIKSIDPVENVETTLNLESKPEKIRLEPSGVELDFSWENNQAKFIIPSIPVYEIVVVE